MTKHLEGVLAQVGMIHHEAGSLQDAGQALRGCDVAVNQKNPHKPTTPGFVDLKLLP